MSNTSHIEGNQNIVIQNITDSNLTINVNGELRQIQNEFEELKALIKNLKIQHIQYADKIYNIEHINEANFGFITGKKVVYNQSLTQKLIEAGADYSTPISEWLKKAQAQAQNWAMQSRISDKAKEIIAFSFVGVIGLQFSKLMAIGKEDKSEAQPQKYLTKSIQLVKYGLDLLNFTLLAHLWDSRNETTPPLDIAHQNILDNFLTSGFELSITQRLTLLETLLQIFEVAKVELPLSELEGFLDTNLQQDSSFRKAILAMQVLQERMDNGQDTPFDCAEAEAQLAAMYVPLAFLVRYKMASIKFINYQQSKQSEPRYLHRYTTLGMDSKANIDVAKMIYTTDTAETDSVWIYKGNDYKNGINLMPFALDYNALTFEHGARICFFMAHNTEDTSFEYVFLDDQTLKKVERKEIDEKEMNKSEWLLEQKNRIVLNFNTAIDLMKRVQKAFLTSVNANFDIDFDNQNP